MALGAVQHPLGGPALATLVVTERHRVARLARVRESVLAAQDALFLSLPVVTGLASADVTTTAIIVAGLAVAVRAADELDVAEVAKELDEIGARPSVEVDELSILLDEEGSAPRDAAAAAASRIAT